VRNAAGSVDISVVPTAPKGFEKNWIPTVPGQAWFTYFDKSWPLPDIEKVKSRCEFQDTRYGIRVSGCE